MTLPMRQSVHLFMRPLAAAVLALLAGPAIATAQSTPTERVAAEAVLEQLDALEARLALGLVPISWTPCSAWFGAGGGT